MTDSLTTPRARELAAVFSGPRTLTADERTQLFVWVRARLAEGAARNPKMPEGAGLTDLRKALGWPEGKAFAALHILAKAAMAVSGDPETIARLGLPPIRK